MAFDTILEHLPIGYAQLDQEYNFIYANTSFCQFVGYQSEELVGRRFFDISHPAEHEADFESFQKIKSGEINTTRQEKRFIHKEGAIISGEVVCARELSATDSFTLALSFAIQAKSKEEEQDEMAGPESFGYLFMNNPQAMMIYSTETLKVLNANDAGIELTGYSREDLLDFDLRNLFSEESWEKLTEFMLTHTEMFRRPQEWPIYTKSGEKRIVESVSHLIHYQGQEARHVMITDITDRKKTEERLRNQKDFINQSQVLAKMGSWDFDIERNVTRWSDNLYRIFGVNKLETKLSFEYFLSLVHPDDQWIISDAYEKILKEKKEVELEHRIVLPDQRVIWIQNNILPEFEDGKLVMLKGVNIDITERKLSELHLNQHIQLENILFEISQDFINANSFTVDHLIHHALEKIGQFTQTDRAYVFQFNRLMTLMDNTHEWCNDGITPQIENLQGLSTDIFPWWMQRMKDRGIINFQDISEIPSEASQEKEILQAQDIISILVLPLFFEGQLKGFVGFDTVSVRKKWEDHDINNLRSLTDLISNVLAHRNREEELVRSKEKAEESLRLKSAFLSTISHELRTPLNPIIGFSDMLPEMTQDAKIREIANFINQSGIEMIHLLEDLFDLSLAQGHRILPNLTKVNCADFYTIAWAILEEILVKAGKYGSISLTYLDSGLSIFHEMEIDQGKALQVLVSLFKNAVKFTEQGEIEFAFRIEPDGSGIELAVRDTGVGFDTAMEAIIFDEFRQVDESLSRNFGGLGIGLAIAKRLITIMEGEIQANSVVGRGSTFTVSLPAPVSCNTRRYDSIQFDASDVDLLRGKTFLVVDDNRFIAEIIAVQLQAFDLRLEFASNGKEALECIQNAVPDLVLMDLYMPVMDGIEATRQIRLIHLDLPIVAMTAHSWPKEHYRSLNAGCNDLITKPIYREILLHKIRQLLKKPSSIPFS